MMLLNPSYRIPLKPKIVISATFLSLCTSALQSGWASSEYAFSHQDMLLPIKYKRLGSETWSDLLTGVTISLENFGQATNNNGSLQLNLNDDNAKVTLGYLTASVSGRAETITSKRTILSSATGITVKDFITQGLTVVKDGHYEVQNMFSIAKNVHFQAKENLYFGFNKIDNQGAIFSEVDQLTIKLVQDMKLGKVGVAHKLRLILEGSQDIRWETLKNSTLYFQELITTNEGIKKHFAKTENSNDEKSERSTEELGNSLDRTPRVPHARAKDAEESFDQEKFHTLQQKYQQQLEIIPELQDKKLQFVLCKILEKTQALNADENDSGNLITHIQSNFSAQTNPEAWLSTALEAETPADAQEILENSDGVKDEQFSGIRLLVIRAKQILGEELMTEDLYQLLRNKGIDSTLALQFLDQKGDNDPKLNIASLEDFTTLVNFVTAYGTVRYSKDIERLGFHLSLARNKMQWLRTAHPFMEKFPAPGWLSIIEIKLSSANFDFSGALKEIDSAEGATTAQAIVMIYDQFEEETREKAIALLKDFQTPKQLAELIVSTLLDSDTVQKIFEIVFSWKDMQPTTGKVSLKQSLEKILPAWTGKLGLTAGFIQTSWEIYQEVKDNTFLPYLKSKQASEKTLTALQPFLTLTKVKQFGTSYTDPVLELAKLLPEGADITLALKATFTVEGPGYWGQVIQAVRSQTPSMNPDQQDETGVDNLFKELEDLTTLEEKKAYLEKV